MWRLYVRFKVELLVRITGDLVVGEVGVSLFHILSEL